LRRAVLADGTERLGGLLESYAVTDDRAERRVIVEELVLALADVEDVAVGSRGANVDARHLAALEKATGSAFVGVTGPNPNAAAGALLETAWGRLAGIYELRLALDAHLGPALPFLEPLFSGDPDAVDVDGLVEFLSAWDGDTGAEVLAGDVACFMKSLGEDGLGMSSRYQDRLLRAPVALMEAAYVALDRAVVGTDEADVLRATASRIAVYGHGGKDVLYGLGGADVLAGGPGADKLYGGAGADRYVFEQGGGKDRVEDSGVDSVVVFGEGIAPGDVSVSRRGWDAVFAYPGGEAALAEWFHWEPEHASHSSAYKAAAVEFADGTVLDDHPLSWWDGIGTVTWLGPGWAITGL
jgi:hypothetical protein